MTIRMRFDRFGDLDVIQLAPPAPVRKLVRAVLETPDAGWGPDDGDKDEIAGFVTDLLVKQKGEMLNVYFGLGFDAATETLKTLPELLDHYVPDLRHLAMFLLRLAIQVDWTSEEACFHDVSRELAEFYMVREGSTTGDCLAQDLREYAAGAAAEGDRGRRSQISESGQHRGVSGDSSAGDTVSLACGVGEEGTREASTAGVGQGQGQPDPSSCAGALGPSAAELYEDERAQGDVACSGASSAGAAASKRRVEDSGMMNALDRSACGGGEWRWCVQHVLFPAMRYLLLPPRVSPNPSPLALCGHA